MQQSADIENRTAEQVLSDHRAALAEGEIDRDVERNYAADAVVISDAGVDRGREAIRQRLLGIAALFGDVVPVVAAQTVVPLDKATFMARVLFSVATPGIEVADGVDTYIIKNGHNNMPAEGPRLKAEEAWDLVNYVRAFAKKKDADTKTQ